MKFGPRGLDGAAGAILAHTLRLGEHTVFKKGRRLSPEDIAALGEAGIDEVTVARLDPDDVGEDEAAQRLGKAIAGPDVVVRDAFTGRCNLHASGRAIALIDNQAAERFNRVDESITLATVQPFAPVDAGDMLATLKVIPFAVPAHVMRACLEVVGEARRPLVTVAPLRPHRAGLVMTRLPGTHESVLDRAEDSQRARLADLGSELSAAIRCDHDVPSVARAIAQLRDRQCAPILVLGASAIVDRHDVVPAALERLGGTVDHFGMPVDPGNLLLFGHLGQVAVVGVPGCARSLRPSGFDWVLQRHLAGLHVGHAEIQSMGVGGLLKDIPTRPQPRHPREPRHEPRVAAILLAAGRSRRMGGENKLLAEIQGQPMVVRAADALLEGPVDQVVVVTGHEAELVSVALGTRPVRLVHNPDYARGLSTSLRAGLDALDDEVDAALIALGDMPWVRPEHVRRLVDAFDPTAGRSICVPVHDRKRGNPVLWGRRFFAEMGRIRGDIGAKHLIEEHSDAVVEVPVPDGGVTVDIDTPETLSALRAREKELEHPQ